MTAKLLRRASKNERTIIPVTKEGYRAWRDRQSKSRKSWLDSQGFDGKTGKLCAIPDETGALAAYLAIIDGEARLWSYAALPSLLPVGNYRISPEPAAKEAEEAALGWLIGCYRFGRYKTKEANAFPKLVRPSKADPRLAETIAGAVHLVRDLINTPANDMGPEVTPHRCRPCRSNWGPSRSARAKWGSQPWTIDRCRSCG